MVPRRGSTLEPSELWERLSRYGETPRLGKPAIFSELSKPFINSESEALYLYPGTLHIRNTEEILNPKPYIYPKQ